MNGIKKEILADIYAQWNVMEQTLSEFLDSFESQAWIDMLEETGQELIWYVTGETLDELEVEIQEA